MKKNIFIALFLLLTFSAFAQKAKQKSQSTKRVVIPEANLEFKANDDYTEVTITKFKCADKDREKFKGKTLEVPSKIQGIPVTAIGERAFNDYSCIEIFKTIEGLYLPDGIKKLEDGYDDYGQMFHYTIKSIRLPEDLEVIGKYCFSGTSMTSITLPSKLKSIEYRAFRGCSLKSITIPASVNYIGESAFEYSGIQKLEFKGNRVFLRVHYNGAVSASFKDCNKLEQIEFPKDFTVLYRDDYPYGITKVPLTDFINGEKIDASFALQKKLKAVKVLTYDEDNAATEKEYSELVNAGKYKEAVAVAQNLHYNSDKWNQVANDTKELEEKTEPYNKDFEAGKYNEAFETARKEQSNKNDVIQNIWKNRAETALKTGYDKSFEKKDYESALDFAKTGHKVFYNNNDWNNRIEDSSLAVYNAALKKKDYDSAMNVASERCKEYSYGNLYENLKDEWEKRKQSLFETYIFVPYLKELLTKGSVTTIDDKLSYEIPLKNYSYYNENFPIIDQLGNKFHVNKDSLLKSLKEISGMDFKMSDNYSIYREATAEEKATYEAQKAAEKAAYEAQKKKEIKAKYLKAFAEGKIHTNLSYKYTYGSTGEPTIEFAEKKGELYVSGIEKDFIFAKKGLQKKDVITKLTVTAEDGSVTEIPLQELTDKTRILKIPAPTTLTFTVVRGKGKKAQTLTIEVPVEWNAAELKAL